MTDLPVTEKESLYPELSTLSTSEIVQSINNEDKVVAQAVGMELSSISAAVDIIFQSLDAGHRLFYIGAGTSGRLGILDASECPPTYGVSPRMVTGIIAGGDKAIRKAVEFAEDDIQSAWSDLQKAGIKTGDVVVGLSASGSTPYVFGGLRDCQQHGIKTISLSCNKGSVISEYADVPIEIEVGPEIITGSTRMKAGTAQKMVLNMLTTTVMVKLGKVKGSKMTFMQLSNTKLIKRGIRMLSEATGMSETEAQEYLKGFKNVNSAIEEWNKKIN